MLAFEQIEADFNKQDTLVFLIEAEDGRSVLSPDVVSFIHNLTEAAWTIPFARRVNSLTNHQRIESEGDDLLVEDLIPEISLTPSEYKNIESYIDSSIRLKNFLISEDKTLTLVTVALSLPTGDEAATKHLVDYTREMLSNMDQTHVQVQLFGSAVINLALAEAVERDMGLLIPGSYLLIFILIFFLTRSLSGTFSALTLTLLTVAAVFGILGWYGKLLTPVVGAVPSMIMIIVIADCMHLLTSYHHGLRNGHKKSRALELAMESNIRPVIVTSVTTAVGLLCLNFSESPPYRDLGNLVAMGALIAGLLSLTWFPALLSVLPAPVLSQKTNQYIPDLLNHYSDYLVKKNYVAVTLIVILILLAGTGLSKLHFNEQWHQYYDETFAVRKALDTQNERLYGVNFIQYVVSADEADGIYSEEYQHQLAELTDWIRQQKNVGYVDSFTEQLREIHHKLNGETQEHGALPDNRELIAQSLLVYELSLPYGAGLEDYINIDKSATRLTVHLHKSTSKELTSLDQIILGRASGMSALTLSEGSGLDMIFAQISDRNSESLLKGTLLALVLISTILIVLLRSFRLGLISLVPNVLPAVMAYGLWGFINGRVDLGLSIVACMGLGLVVDDTVHFLSKYQFARKQGNSAEQAVRYAFSTVGVAMVITTAALFSGFALLAFSSFSPTQGMGILLALTVIFALLIDFILLPVLLLRYDR